MKIKIKYLLGLLLFGFGLLINQSFADVYIDLVTPLSAYSSSAGGANYLYRFINTIGINPNYGYLGYKFYKNGIEVFDSVEYPGTSNTSCTTSSILFNDSVFSYSPYNDWCVSAWQNVSHTTFYHTTNYKRDDWLGYLYVYLGQNENFGNNFLTIATNSTGPVYGFGSGFFTSSDLLQVSDQFSSYYRFFYNYNQSGNIFSNPVDGFNVISMTGSTQKKSYAWEYFYPRGTRTNYGYIVDDGSLYTKYKHFGLFGMGYSYIYGKHSQSSQSISWDNLGLRTVSDNIQVSLQHLGDVSYNSFNSYSSNFSNLSWNGILLLRSKSVLQFNQDDGVYLFSKDPTNYQRFLYEHWSCATDNIDLILHGSGCVKLDGGYLTYNGSTNVFPFIDSTTSYSITGLNSNYPLLYDLINGGYGLTDLYGYNQLVSSDCFNFNKSTRCYGFSSNSSVDIVSLYLDSVDSGSNSNNYSGSGSLTDDCVITEVCRYSSGSNGENIKYCTNRCLSSGVVNSGSYIGFDGTIYYVNSDLNIDNLINGDDTYLFNPSYLDSGGLLSTDFYSGLFDGTSSFKLGVCPYPESNFFGFVTRLRIGNFYPFMPLNCFVSAFQQGVKIHYFDDFELFPNLDSQLINGDTHFHKTLFRFFDLLLSLGVLFVLSALHRLIKK